MKYYKKLQTLSLVLLLVITTINTKPNIANAEGTPITTSPVQNIHANNLFWEQSSNTNILGGAANMGGLFFDELKNFHESGAPVAARKMTNVNILGFEVGLTGNINRFDNVTIPQFNVIGIAEEVNFNKGEFWNESATKVDNADFVGAPGINKDKLTLINSKSGIYERNEVYQYFNDAETDLKNRYDKIIKLPETNYDKNIVSWQATYTLLNDGGVAVLDLDDDFNNYQLGGAFKPINFSYDTEPDLIIIRSKYPVMQLGDLMINGTSTGNSVVPIMQKILWVFENENVEMKNTHLLGSTLAPYTNFNFSSTGSFNGPVIGNSLELSSNATGTEFHYIGPFTGKFEEPEVSTIDIDVQKIWEVNGSVVNGALIGVESITVGLFKDESKIDEVVLNKDNNWTHTFKDLVESDDYTVEELEEEYKGVVTGDKESGFTITNNIETQLIDIDVKKVWKGDATDAVTIKLLKDGVVEETITLNEGNDWAHTFKDLPKTDEYLNEHEYKIKEIEVDGYSSIVTGNALEGFTVTNTRSEKTSIKATKVWHDDIAKDRPDITLELYIKGEENPVDTKTLTKGDTSVEFENLDKFDDKGQLIEYVLKEQDVAGYKSVVTGNVAIGFTVTNTRFNDEYVIPVEKTWNGKKLDEVVIELYRSVDENEAVYIKSITLNETGDWKGLFTNLDEFDEDGKAYEYSVKEIEHNRYDSKVSGDATNGFTVENTFKPETYEIPFRKIWKGEATEELTFQLFEVGNETPLKAIVVDEASNWEGTFTNVPKTDINGKPLNYEVHEVLSENNYRKSSETIDGVIVFTNIRFGLLNIPVEKTWDGKALESLQVDLYRESKKESKSYVQSLTLKADENEANNWKGVFENLVEFDHEGNPYTYTIQENILEALKDRYDVEVKLIGENIEDGFMIKNTYKPELIDIDVEKVWQGEVLKGITLILLQNGEKLREVTLSKPTIFNLLSKTSGWSYTFKDLPKTDKQGVAYTYTIEEVEVEGYESKVTGNEIDGFTITNTRHELTDIPVEKIWLGSLQLENKSSINKITVILKANDVEIESADITADENGNWNHIFKDVPLFDEVGEPITYSIEELLVPGFTSVVEGDAKDGFTITNTKTGKTEVHVRKEWDGLEADAVVVELLRNGEPTNTSITLNQENDWNHTFKDLDAFDNEGKAYLYSVKEQDLEGYESKIETITQNNFKITNSYKTEPLNLKISKAWKPENPDQTKLSEIKVDIFQDGLLFETVTLNAPKWEEEVSLNKNDKFGHEYEYTIKEQHVDGYTSLITGDVEKGFKITNTRLENMDIKVDKVFAISSPVDASSIEFDLLQNGIVIDTVILKNPNWSDTFKNMPAFDHDGRAYAYTVEETKVDDTPVENSKYEAVVEGNASDGFTIYNTYEPEFHEKIAIKKIWIGKEATSATVQLMMTDGVTSTMVETLELSKDNNWQALVTNLPKTNPKGVAYTYTFKEIDVDEDRYEIGETLGNIEEGFTITNTYIPETTDIAVRKQWINGPDINKVEVELLQIMGDDSQRYNDEIITLKATDNFEYIWKDVPKTDIEGNPYIYVVNEVSNDQGVVTIKVDGVDHKFKLTFATTTGNTWVLRNEYVIEEIEVEFSKEWVGGPETKPEIKIQLLRNGLAYQDPITLKNGETTGKWANLPKTDLKGNPYTYTVDEVEVPENYLKKVDGFTITNTFSPGLRELTFKKIWNGGPEIKPAITVQLFQNDLAFDDPVEFTNGTQDYTWPKQLPIKDENGKDYVYTIDEINVPENYEKFVEGMTINNTYISPKKDITVEKVWSGGLDDKSYLSYSVQLFRKLETEDEFVAASDKILLPGNVLEHTFKSLDVTDEFGNVYEYKVDEIDVPTNYEKSVDGYTITNTYKVPKTEINVTKVWVGGPKDKPTIELQLYRDGVAYSEEPYNVPVELTNGENAFTFSNLDETDANGLKYLYTVDEVNVPENYIKSIDGLEITNTYTSPKTEVTVEKNWVGGKTPRPDIYVQLFRNGSPEGSPVKLTEGNTSHTWIGLDTTDKDAVNYTYTVDEVDVPSNYNKVVTGDATNGFVITNTLKTYAIGDYTWIDEPKQNGLQDAEQEVLPGVIVELYDKTGTNLLDSTTTDENGKYIFDELVAGEYTIKFTLTKEQAEKYEFTIQNVTGIFNKEKVDSDADQSTGWTKVIKLDDDNKYLTRDYKDQPFKATEGIDSTWDAGVILKKVEPEKPVEKTYAIGDYVWVDDDYTGAQGQDKIVLPGVKVTLFDAKGHVVDEKMTDENGRYHFDNLPAGDYKVHFELTEEQAKVYTFTKKNYVDDERLDSDSNRKGYTVDIKLDDSNKHLSHDYDYVDIKATQGIDPTWDAGVVRKQEVKLTLTLEKIWLSKATVSELEFILLADGLEAKRITLTQEKMWQDVVSDLPAYNADKELIVYSVVEQVPEGYNASYETIQNDESHDLIILIINSPQDTPKPSNPDATLPLTGSVTILPMVGFGLMGMAAVLWIVSKKKLNEE